MYFCSFKQLNIKCIVYLPVELCEVPYFDIYKEVNAYVFNCFFLLNQHVYGFHLINVIEEVIIKINEIKVKTNTNE